MTDEELKKHLPEVDGLSLKGFRANLEFMADAFEATFEDLLKARDDGCVSWGDYQKYFEARK